MVRVYRRKTFHFWSMDAEFACDDRLRDGGSAVLAVRSVIALPSPHCHGELVRIAASSRLLGMLHSP